MNDDQFTVEGTLIKAWARLKGFECKGEKASERPTELRSGESYGGVSWGEANSHDP